MISNISLQNQSHRLHHHQTRTVSLWPPPSSSTPCAPLGMSGKTWMSSLELCACWASCETLCLWPDDSKIKTEMRTGKYSMYLACVMSVYYAYEFTLKTVPVKFLVLTCTQTFTIIFNMKCHSGSLYRIFLSKLLTEQRGSPSPRSNHRAKLLLGLQNNNKDDAWTKYDLEHPPCWVQEGHWASFAWVSWSGC